MLHIVFFGTPAFAVSSLDALLASPHKVITAVTQPDRPRGRGQQISASPVKARAEAHDINVLQPEKLRTDEFLEMIRALEPDLGVVAAYGRLLPESLLAIPRLGIINVHASLLPRYRGAAPIQRAIMEGERETGVTIMRVVKALDAGAMILKRSTPIEPDETGDALEARLASIGGALLVEAVALLEQGRAIEEPQDASQATYAARIAKTDGVIAWDRPAQAIHDQVRGLHPWPHAFSVLDGARLVIHETRPFSSLQDAVTACRLDGGTPLVDGIRAPGTVMCAVRDCLLVAAGDGSVLALRRVQEEGRRVVDVRAFLAGHPVRAEARFAVADLA